jgi:hypothetical protein
MNEDIDSTVAGVMHKDIGSTVAGLMNEDIGSTVLTLLLYCQCLLSLPATVLSMSSFITCYCTTNVFIH